MYLWRSPKKLHYLVWRITWTIQRVKNWRKSSSPHTETRISLCKALRVLLHLPRKRLLTKYALMAILTSIDSTENLTWGADVVTLLWGACWACKCADWLVLISGQNLQSLPRLGLPFSQEWRRSCFCSQQSFPGQCQNLLPKEMPLKYVILRITADLEECGSQRWPGSTLDWVFHNQPKTSTMTQCTGIGWMREARRMDLNNTCCLKQKVPGAWWWRKLLQYSSLIWFTNTEDTAANVTQECGKPVIFLISSCMGKGIGKKDHTDSNGSESWKVSPKPVSSAWFSLRWLFLPAVHESCKTV